MSAKGNEHESLFNPDGNHVAAPIPFNDAPRHLAKSLANPSGRHKASRGGVVGAAPAFSSTCRRERKGESDRVLDAAALQDRQVCHSKQTRRGWRGRGRGGAILSLLISTVLLTPSKTIQREASSTYNHEALQIHPALLCEAYFGPPQLSRGGGLWLKTCRTIHILSSHFHCERILVPFHPHVMRYYLVLHHYIPERAA